MKGFERLVEIWDSGKFLTNVQYVVDPILGVPTSIRMIFEELGVSIRVDPDWDTLVVEPCEADVVRGQQVYDASHEAVWARTIRTTPQWIWRLTNQQGYSDGLQFEFIDKDAKREWSVQILASASQIKVRTVSDVPRSSRV